ncbi:MAG: MarR family winged helix-turn-helix transcriptional regulator [Thermoplasmataceae archaeon]
MGEEVDRVEVWKSLVDFWRNAYSLADRNLSSLGVSMLQYKTLSHLMELGGAPMAKLASMNFVTQGWMTSVIDSLEENGLAERVRSRDDRRIINVQITEKGRLLFTEASKLHTSSVKNILRPLSDLEVSTFYTILMKLNANEIQTKEENNPPDND